jgi:hypothetical protein
MEERDNWTHRWIDRDVEMERDIEIFLLNYHLAISVIKQKSKLNRY